MEANADEPTVAVYFRAKGTRTYVLIDSGTPEYAHGILMATYRTKRGLGGDATASELRHAHGLKAYTMSRYALFAGTPATYEVNIADR